MTTLKQLSKILLVDDNEQNRYVMSRTLRSPQLEIEECSTGVAALERVRSLPDLVILDIRLPDIPGYEVCRRIKQDPATAHIAVLQVSAFIGEQGKAAALAAGADALLTHPIDPAVLLDVVATLLSAKKSASKP
ncbi:MAG TPA: response regulator [Candidatus Angelobacter sp.]|nr:response regulator [Candidatus Angelobacter sp.]